VRTLPIDDAPRARPPAETSVEHGLEAAEVARARGDPAAALDILADVARSFPQHAVAPLRTIEILSQLGRLDEAEAALAEGAGRFPDEAGFAIQRARLAQLRGALDEAERLYARLRREIPTHSIGFTAAAGLLRDRGDFTGADALLREAMERFPAESGPVFEFAWVAHRKADWPEAERRWQAVRERFPDVSAGYTGVAHALRELGRFAQADALLVEAMERFPDDRAPRSNYAWVATVRRDWAQAAIRWRQVRERFPLEREGYLREGQALAALLRDEEAEAMLVEGMARLPKDAELAHEHAWIAYRRHDAATAAARFAELRERFPEAKGGYTGGALALRDLFRLREAEALLEEAQRHFPDDPSFVLAHARIPMFHPLRRERQPELAVARLEALRERFPDFEEGYLQAIRYLRDSNRFDDADALAAAALERLPGSAAVRIEYARTAGEHGDRTAAVERFRNALQRHPGNADAGIGLVASLSSAGRHEEAERAAREAMARFPTLPAAFAEFARVAARRGDRKEALERWREAARRFPEERDLVQRIYEAELYLLEPAPDGDDCPTVPPALARPAHPMDATDAREVMLAFTSLGGRQLGCEFGMVQRDFGAEPIALLRWADMPYESLVRCLESRFEGVAGEEYTELIVNRENGRPEYCTQDRRGFLYTRTFVYEDEMPRDRMWTESLRRLAYLKRQLIADLERGERIFVYRVTESNLAAPQVERLHAAMRAYGNNMLLYVRYEDGRHPNGTVELAAPGLMVGYIDRFKISPEGRLSASPPSASWLAVCRRAHRLWREGLTAGVDASRALAVSKELDRA